MSAQIALYLLVAQAAIIGVVLGALTLSYVRLSARYAWLKKRHLDELSSSHSEARKVLDAAHKEALTVLVDAKKYQDIYERELSLRTSELFSKLEPMLGQKIAELVSSESGKASQKIEEQFRSVVLDFDMSLKKISSDFLQQTENYRQTIFGKIDAEAYSLIKEVFEDVVSKQLSEEVHEDLVLNSLENAKRNHLFTNSK